MIKVSVHISAESFGKTFKKMLDLPKFKISAYQIMESVYNAARERLITNFNESPITREIEAGVGSENISNLLDGYGNLYSFIGFDAGEENPIIELRDYIEESITLEQTVRRDNKWFFRITVPSRKDIASVTPMAWEDGTSWVEGVEEEGITNLSHYIAKAWESSRSGGGIQVPEEYREGAHMHTSPYILKMLQEFRGELITE